MQDIYYITLESRSKHKPGDQWNCKCWLEQTDAEPTPKEKMPSSADMPEPKAGLRGNTAKTKEIFSQDHPHFPDKCTNCFAYEESDTKSFSFFDFTKNCPNCPMIARCMIIVT